MNYSKINLFDIANGEGIRVSLFVSGCKFNCKGCFNKEAQDFNYKKEYTANTVAKIYNELALKDYTDGLSILGGDPLCQDIDGIKALLELVNMVHSLNKDVWIWSGYTWDEVMNPKDKSMLSFYRKVLLCACDVFVDGRFEEDLKDLSLAWRGSSNQRVIDVHKSMKGNRLYFYESKKIRQSCKASNKSN